LITPDALMEQAAKIGLTLDHDMAAMAIDMVSALPNAWQTDDVQAEQRSPSHDPLNAVACVVDNRPSVTGALSGTTVAIKDNIAVRGVATALGSGVPGCVATQDATLVSRLSSAGAEIIAKAQCEAFLLGANSFSSMPAPVRNPHDVARSAGGSSSGSAAMVAAGLSDCAIGTDSGGSIRIPASYCGIVGFKPSRGFVPYTGIAPLAPWLEAAGPMAQTVADAARLFKFMAGPDGRDIRQGWAPKLLAGEPPTSLSQVNVGVFDAAVSDCDSDVQGLFAEAVSRIGNAGARTKHFVWADFDATRPLHLAIYLISDALNGAGSGTGTDASDPIGWRAWRRSIAMSQLPAPLPLSYATGLALNETDPGLLSRAINQSSAIADSLDSALQGLDAILLPVSHTVAPLIPTGEPTFDEYFGDTQLTAPFNVTGHPVVALPIGKSGHLPVGVQIVGPRGADHRLLAIASLIENALGRLAPATGDFGTL
jgi:amidase